jgi:hypothetical protein
VLRPSAVGWLGEPLDAESAAAAAHDVIVVPLGQFSRQYATREGAHLGFAAIDPAGIGCESDT